MFRAIRRSFTEGVRGMVKNGHMTVTSLLVVTACIFVFGVFLMMILNINYVTGKMADEYQVDVYISKEVPIDNTQISVFVDRDANMEDEAYNEKLKNVETLIMGVENVDISSIKFTDAQTRFNEFVSSLPDEEKKAYENIDPATVGNSYALVCEEGADEIETIRLLSELEGVSKVYDGDDMYTFMAELGGISKNVSSSKYEEIKKNLKAEIYKLSNIDINNIGYVDGKEKFKEFKKDLTAEELKDFEGLPDDLIPDAYAVRMKDLSEADKTIAELEALENVESVENSREFISVIDNLKDMVQKISIWIIVAFALVSLFIISNTIKLTVHNRRKEINIMKYVGATDSYIRGPFIMEGILLGILSAIIAFFISQWTYQGLMTAISASASGLTADLSLMKFNQLWIQLISSYLILGSVIGAFGSSISVRRYLHV